MVVLRKSAGVLGYKLEPREQGWGMMRLRLWPGEGGGRSGPSDGAWPEHRIPWVGRRSSAATGRSHAGPLVLHLVTLAPSSPAPTAGLELKEKGGA